MVFERGLLFFSRMIINSIACVFGEQIIAIILKSSLHCLISHGRGLLVIPENKVPEFKKLLVKYYEGENLQVIASFMREYCWRH